MGWRLLLSPPMDGPANMGLDHALMDRARRRGESILRVYGWAGTVLSLGRNQRARNVYDERALAARSVTVVRRPTGGRALLHDREITYSVIMPLGSGSGLQAVYADVNGLLLDTLAFMGVDASIAQPLSRSRAPDTRPCFAEPARGELITGGRKLVGSAQWHDDGVLLQHGSILVDDDQSALPLLSRDALEPPPAPATLRAALGRVPSLEEFASVMFATLRARTNVQATTLREDELDHALHATFVAHYRDPEWTWRR